MITLGVDLGIRKAAVAVFYDEELHHVIAYEAQESWSRAEQLYAVGNWVSSLVTDAHITGEDELYLFVEQPLVGNNIKYSLNIAMTYGAVLSHCSVWVASGLKIYGVNVSEWKKEVIGKGNAGKDDVKKHISVVSRRYSALCGDDQDKYDATCVGIYGVRIAGRAAGMASA